MTNFMDEFLDWLESTTPQERIRAARAADPGYVEPAESDWRDQTVIDVEKLSEDTRADGQADRD